MAKLYTDEEGLAKPASDTTLWELNFQSQGGKNTEHNCLITAVKSDWSVKRQSIVGLARSSLHVQLGAHTHTVGCGRQDYKE